ncbi:hypothetical protein AVEN_262264-1 [Araneus ventricosus]|uniref:Endonuclease/exonuclease/phosphatase domain-containing protein n=1 Tax=Araneus ventricosus TaxID=182803 RepID=A0A4Y2P7B7_ARAVE|nr:hypothetical protein AVEN_262264-1 [Araneus ventricosus]
MRSHLWFLHDGAPAHYSIGVRLHLNATYGQQWIGRVVQCFGPLDRQTFTLDLENLIAFNTIIFIAGDFNAKSRTWNCRTGYRFGKQLETFARLTGQKIIAPVIPTRYDRRRATIIDLAVTRNFNYACNATAEDELSSDHLPVKFWLNTNTDPYLNKTYRPHLKNFQQQIISNPTNNFNQQCVNDIEEEIKRFTTELQTTFKGTGKWVEKQNEEHSNEIRIQT